VQAGWMCPDTITETVQITHKISVGTSQRTHIISNLRAKSLTKTAAVARDCRKQQLNCVH